MNKLIPLVGKKVVVNELELELELALKRARAIERAKKSCYNEKKFTALPTPKRRFLFWFF